MDYNIHHIELQVLSDYKQLIRVAIDQQFKDVLRAPEHYITLAIALEESARDLAQEYRQQAVKIHKTDDDYPLTSPNIP